MPEIRQSKPCYQSYLIGALRIAATGTPAIVQVFFCGYVWYNIPMLELKTKLGDIHFSRNVIRRIVIDAVNECDGKVNVFHYGGKYSNVVPGIASLMNINIYDADPGSIEILDKSTGMEITVYVVIKFGTSIKKTSKSIIDYIYENVEMLMGEKPAKVRVRITGVESKDISRRRIEISR